MANPEHIDRLVAEQIARMRVLQGVSQQELAEKLNISQQQVRKYESGQDRVSAGRLAQIADSLGVPVAAFYALEPCRFHKLERVSLELNRAFLSIPNRQVQRFIVLMVKGVAAKYPLFLEEETRQEEQFHA